MVIRKGELSINSGDLPPEHGEETRLQPITPARRSSLQGVTEASVSGLVVRLSSPLCCFQLTGPQPSRAPAVQVLSGQQSVIRDHMSAHLVKHHRTETRSLSTGLQVQRLRRTGPKRRETPLHP